jgi:hypothetical protein
MDIEQQENLERVTAAIGEVIEEFWRERLRGGDPTFYAADLLAFVRERAAIAPDSPSRILRALRQARRVNYAVVSRSDSFYRALPLAEA